MGTTGMKRWLGLLLGIVCLTAPLHADEVLQGPLEVPRIRATWGRPAPSTVCPPVPVPLRRLHLPAVTPAAEWREEDSPEARPLLEYEAGLNRLADAYLQSAPADLVDAQCALGWLGRWAQEDAMDGTVGQGPHFAINGTGAWHQERFLVVLALDYLKVRDDPRLSPDARVAVETWVHRMGESVAHRYNPRKGNHHLYWAGAGVQLAGVVSHDRHLFDWGVQAGLQGIREITLEGYLPQELARGTLATHYHYFSALPLMLIADTAWHNGVDIWSQNAGGLHRMARALMNMERNPQYLAPVIGLKQASDPNGDGLHAAWWEIYHARFPTYLADFQDVVQDLLAHRPYRYDWGGGNVTLEFGTL